MSFLANLVVTTLQGFLGMQGFNDWILLVLWTFDLRFRDQILDPKVQG